MIKGYKEVLIKSLLNSSNNTQNLWSTQLTKDIQSLCSILGYMDKSTLEGAPPDRMSLIQYQNTWKVSY